MKIRIKGNSIRLRLVQKEVKQFGETGIVKDDVNFINSKFSYQLIASKEVDQLSATFESNCISVIMPYSMKNDWVNSDKVGFENQYKLNESSSLFILVEKDFVCLDNTFEDQSDNYPNPNAVC